MLWAPTHSHSVRARAYIRHTRTCVCVRTASSCTLTSCLAFGSDVLVEALGVLSAKLCRICRRVLLRLVRIFAQLVKQQKMNNMAFEITNTRPGPWLPWQHLGHILLDWRGESCIAIKKQFNKSIPHPPTPCRGWGGGGAGAWGGGWFFKLLLKLFC